MTGTMGIAGDADKEYAAGHVFLWGRCSCGIMWEDIMDVGREMIGKMGVAHEGNLTENEWGSIRDLAKRKRDKVATVMGWSKT